MFFGLEQFHLESAVTVFSCYRHLESICCLIMQTSLTGLVLSLCACIVRVRKMPAFVSVVTVRMTAQRFFLPSPQCFTFPDQEVWFFCSSDHAVGAVPISGHAEPCQSSTAALQPLPKVVVVLLCKGMAQTIAILHPCEMRTTAEYEIVAGNMAKTGSL